VIELGIPELESLKREVGFEIMRERERERWWRERDGLDMAAGGNVTRQM
jgi:hypothetical protein